MSGSQTFFGATLIVVNPPNSVLFHAKSGLFHIWGLINSKIKPKTNVKIVTPVSWTRLTKEHKDRYLPFTLLCLGP